MAVRTICCLPGVTGAWRHVGGGAMLSTSKLYPFSAAALERPDLIPRGTRTVNMSQLAEALLGELPGPPVLAMYVYNSNPAAVAPDQSRVLKGMMREDLFTVVHEQFQTDTADYADIVLPATTQLEHFDIHASYGHLYVQVNEPAIAPLHEAKSNNDVFRLLARGMGFEPETFESSDVELAAESMSKKGRPQFPATDGFQHISLERLRGGTPLRLNLPTNYAPFAEGNFPTPTGKCEIYSPRLVTLGQDPLPHYIPPHEDPQTRPDLAREHPLQLISPPVPEFLNSTFVNIDSLRRAAGEPTVDIHPDDAQPRGIVDGDRVEVFNKRGTFQAKARVGPTVKPGVLMSPSVWWNRYAKDKKNCNTTTSTKLTDFGAGATFFDNLVQVRRATDS